MTLDAAMAGPLECFTTLLIGLMRLNELWITMGGLTSTSITHYKNRKLREGSVCDIIDMRSPDNNGIGCSHAKVIGVLNNPFDITKN